MQQIKKGVLIFLLGILLLAYSGCQTGPKQFAIGISLQHLQYYEADIQKMIDSYNLEENETAQYTLIRPANDTRHDQTDAVKSLLAQKANVLLVALSSAEDAEEIADLAKQNKTPLVILGQEPIETMTAIWKQTYFVCDDSSARWEVLGELIGGLKNGSDADEDGVVRYVTLAADNSAMAAAMQTAESRGLQTEQIASLTDALQLESLLQEKENPVDLLVIADSGDGVLIDGAQDAIAKAGRKVGVNLFAVSAGDTPKEVDLVEQGKLSGTLSPKEKVLHAVQVAYQLLHKEEVSAVTQVYPEMLRIFRVAGVLQTEPVSTGIVEALQTKFETSRSESKEYNVSYKFVYDLEDVYNVEAHTQQLQTATAYLEEGIDVLLVLVTKSHDEFARLARAYHTPVIFYRHGSLDGAELPYEHAYYAIEDKDAPGIAQGEIIRDLKDQGDIDGDGVVRYIMISGESGNFEASIRTETSIQVLRDAGLQLDCLLQRSGGWDTDNATEIAVTALQQFGNKIDVIFCNNDLMAVGAEQAIRAAGKEVGKDLYLVGIDGIDEAVQLVRNGKMTGTVIWGTSDDDADMLFEMMMRIVDRQPIEAYNYLPITKVTA